MAEHELRGTYAGFHCTCGGWRVGSINDPGTAFARHAHDPRCISLTDSEFNNHCDCRTLAMIDGATKGPTP